MLLFVSNQIHAAITASSHSNLNSIYKSSIYTLPIRLTLIIFLINLILKIIIIMIILKI